MGELIARYARHDPQEQRMGTTHWLDPAADLRNL